MNNTSKKAPFKVEYLEKTEITKNSVEKIKTNNTPIIIVNVLALLCSALALINLIFVGFSALSLLLAVGMILVDCIHLIYSLLANYRFLKNVINSAVIILANLILSSLILIFDSINATSGFSHGYMTITIVIKICILVLFVLGVLIAVFSQKGNKAKIIALSIISVIILGGSAAYFTTNGFYGTSANIMSGNRALRYSYDDELGGYVVESTFTGANKKISVPDTYNGSDVVAISMSILADKSLHEIELPESHTVTFKNADRYVPNDNLKITVSKTLFDEYRKEILITERDNYYAKKANYAIKLANCFEPILAKGEKYLAFTYDISAVPELLKECYIPTVYSFSSFNPKNILSDTQYKIYADNMKNYEWSYIDGEKLALTNPRYIENKIITDKGLDSLSGSISDSANLYLSFDKVFKATVEKGEYIFNPSSWTDTIYFTADDIAYDLNSVRVGCDVSWVLNNETQNYSVNIGTDKNAFGEVVKTRKFASEDELNLIPKWTVIAPVIQNFGTNLNGNNGTYGDLISFNANIAEHALSNNMYYKFYGTVGGKTIVIVDTTKYDGSFDFADYIQKLMLVKESGTYTLEITAIDLDDSKLKTTVKSNINLKISPKVLNVDWLFDNESGISSIDYDGLTHTLKGYINPNQFVREDNPLYNTGEISIKNANSYTALVTFTSTQENYVINTTQQSKTFTIARALLNVSFGSDESLVYNGRNQTVTSEVSGYKANEIGNYTITYNTTPINAGTYVIYIKLQNKGSFDIKNYTFVKGKSETSVNSQFSIKPYVINDIYWEDTSKIYSGNIQKPAVYFYDINNSKLYIDVESSAKNVGEHTVTAKNTNSNYEIKANLNTVLSITPREITNITWSNTSLTYNGDTQTPTAYFMGLGQDGRVNMNVSGNGVNVGNYKAQAYNVNSNYNVTASNERDYLITAKTVNAIDWTNITVTYNGAEQKPQASFKGVKNEIVVLTVNGSGVNAGSYTVSAFNNNGNYNVTGSLSRTFTITPFNITEIIWGNREFVYDGLSHKPTAQFNGVNGEVIPMNVTGEKINAGSYTATASNNNSNYKITCALTTSFTINAKAINLSWTMGNYESSFNLDEIRVTTENYGITYKYFDSDNNEIRPEDMTDGNTYSKVAISTDSNYSFENDSYSFVKRSYSEELN